MSMSFLRAEVLRITAYSQHLVVCLCYDASGIHETLHEIGAGRRASMRLGNMNTLSKENGIMELYRNRIKRWRISNEME